MRVYLWGKVRLRVHVMPKRELKKMFSAEMIAVLYRATKITFRFDLIRDSGVEGD